MKPQFLDHELLMSNTYATLKPIIGHSQFFQSILVVWPVTQMLLRSTLSGVKPKLTSCLGKTPYIIMLVLSYKLRVPAIYLYEQALAAVPVVISTDTIVQTSFPSRKMNLGGLSPLIPTHYYQGKGSYFHDFQRPLDVTLSNHTDPLSPVAWEQLQYSEVDPSDQ